MAFMKMLWETARQGFRVKVNLRLSNIQPPQAINVKINLTIQNIQ